MKRCKHFCMHLECDSITFITATGVKKNCGERQKTHTHNTLTQDKFHCMSMQYHKHIFIITNTMHTIGVDKITLFNTT